MDEGLLTDREIALLVVFGAVALIALVAASRKPGALRSLRRAPLGFFHWKLAVPILMYLGCLSVAVWAAARLGIWEWGLWKPTALWLVLGGIGMLFKHEEAIEQSGFGWRVSIRTIALVEIVSFVADLASFPLRLEIPAQALAFVASIVSARAADTQPPTPTSRFANLYLILFSLAAVGWAIGRAVSDWESLDHGLLVREFFVPIWLTPVALVSVYAFAVFCVYETAFVQMTLAADGRSMFKQRLAVVLRTAGRVGRLRALRRAGGWRFAHTNGFGEAWAEVGEILRPGAA